MCTYTDVQHANDPMSGCVTNAVQTWWWCLVVN